MKKSVPFFALALGVCFSLSSQTFYQLPAHPTPGKCYVKTITPDYFDEIKETVVVEPAYKKIVTIPATFKTIEERVMVKEATKMLVYVPAVFETVTVEYVSKEATKNLVSIPAYFGQDSKTIEVYPITSKWEFNYDPNCSSPNINDCIVARFVESPARFETVNITTLVRDASVSDVFVPEERKTYSMQVVKTPPRIDEVEIPAEYAIVKRQVVERPARQEEIIVPAVTKAVTRTVLSRKGGETIWEEIDCGLLEPNILPIHYDYNSSNLTPEARLIIDKHLLSLMTQKPNIRVEIMAHTDSRGNANYNMSLSQQRALSVVNYLVSRGISQSRFVAKGYGETRLINNCTEGVQCTEEQHQVNRRTEFRVIQ